MILIDGFLTLSIFLQGLRKEGAAVPKAFRLSEKVNSAFFFLEKTHQLCSLEFCKDSIDSH